MSGKAGKAASRGEEADWQRLDLWLWCARVAKARPDCARLVEQGAVRLNRQSTVKAHARLRIGDVLTMALRDEVRVWRVKAMAARRGPAAEARLLYDEVPEGAGGEMRHSNSCAKSGPAAYGGAQAEGAAASPRDGDDRSFDRDGSDEKAVEPAGDFRRTATRSAE